MGSYRVTKSINGEHPRFRAEYRPTFLPFWNELYGEFSDEGAAWARAKGHKNRSQTKETCLWCVAPFTFVASCFVFVIWSVVTRPVFGVRLSSQCEVLEIVRESVAHASGVRAGDKIIKTDVATECFSQDLVVAKEVTVMRDGKELTINIVRR